MGIRTIVKQIWGAESLATDLTSGSIDIESLQSIGITFDCQNVTNNTGVFSVEVSNDEVTWFTHTSATALANTDSKFLMNLADVAYKHLRVFFDASGTPPDGDVTAWICGKSV